MRAYDDFGSGRRGWGIGRLEPAWASNGVRFEEDLLGEQADCIPGFLEAELANAYPDDVVEAVRNGYEAANGRPVTLRANALKASSEEVEDALDRAGIAFRRVPWYGDAFVLEGARERDVWDLPIYAEGGVYLQSLSSMLPPLVMEPRAGTDVLDMCAAPGGKTSQIAALTGGGARITACEINGPRAEKLSYNLGKLGVGNVNIMKVDARRLDELFSFDQVLVDAPCTGSGTVRAGDPKAQSRITSKLLQKTLKQQSALLDRALMVLKPGGRLVYSTCSVLPGENEEQVERALARHRDCRLDPISGAGGIDLSDPPFETLPTSIDGTIAICPGRLFEGFFVARIKKVR